MSEKPSPSEIASTIGTWLAVGLALFALVGIVGPVLIWRATKSERNRAINALEQGGGETFGYTSHGVWTGTRIRLLRQVRAPLLHVEPQLGSNDSSLEPIRFEAMPTRGPRFRKKIRDRSTGSPPSVMSSGWVQFGSIIEGYNLPMETGDNLAIRDEQALLPVHTSWLLLTGLLGRYGPWQDKGRLPPRIAPGIRSNQATIASTFARNDRAGSRPRFVSGIPIPGRKTPSSWKKSSAAWADRHDYRSVDDVRYQPLYGLNGIMYFPTRGLRQRPGDTKDMREQVFFSRHNRDRIGDIVADTYNLGMLFWMAVGCIPGPQGCVICLDDVEDVPIYYEPPPKRDNGKTATALRPPQSRNARAVIVDGRRAESSDSDSGSWEDDHTAAVFITPKSYSHEEESTRDPSRPRAFCLAPWNERDNALSNLASIVHADSPDLQVLSLQEVAISASEAQDIKEADDSTYFDRQSKWLRLTSDSRGLRCLRRADAQLVALALLTLTLNPNGYLMSSRPSPCRELFCEAAESSLPQLLARTQWSIDALRLEQGPKENLAAAMSRFYDLSQPVKRTRPYFAALYKLDVALQEAIKASSAREDIAFWSLGCVMLTSPEFRSLITQSARLLSEGFEGSIVINLGDSSIEVPMVMNFIAKFPIDTETIFPDARQEDLSGTPTVPLAKVLLVCQRAALRSAMLDTALDSVPLFERVQGLSEVVLLG